jgi:hypothetical protein
MSVALHQNGPEEGGEREREGVGEYGSRALTVFNSIYLNVEVSNSVQ